MGKEIESSSLGQSTIKGTTIQDHNKRFLFFKHRFYKYPPPPFAFGTTIQYFINNKQNLISIYFPDSFPFFFLLFFLFLCCRRFLWFGSFSVCLYGSPNRCVLFNSFFLFFLYRWCSWFSFFWTFWCDDENSVSDMLGLGCFVGS